MNIIYIEDNGNALHKIENIKEEMNHTVWHTQNFLTLLSWLDDSPGANHFDVLMFDLNLPADSLPELDPNDKYAPQKHFSPSLYFIDKYIKKYCNLFTDKKRIIICTAFLGTYKQHTSFENYHVIDKQSDTIINDIKNVLNEVEATL